MTKGIGIKVRPDESIESALRRFRQTIGDSRRPKSQHWQDVCFRSGISQWGGNRKGPGELKKKRKPKKRKDNQ